MYIDDVQRPLLMTSYVYVRGKYAVLAIYGAIVGTVRRENPK